METWQSWSEDDYTARDGQESPAVSGYPKGIGHIPLAGFFFFPLEVTAIQSGVLPLLTHSASNFHMEHVFQPSDNLENVVSSFKVRAGERDAKILARNQVLHL